MANEKRNIFNKLGMALSGFSAPFLGDNDWEIKQANLAFRKWQEQNDQTYKMKALYTDYLNNFLGTDTQPEPLPFADFSDMFSALDNPSSFTLEEKNRIKKEAPELYSTMFGKGGKNKKAKMGIVNKGKVAPPLAPAPINNAPPMFQTPPALNTGQLVTQGLQAPASEAIRGMVNPMALQGRVGAGIGNQLRSAMPNALNNVRGAMQEFLNWYRKGR